MTAKTSHETFSFINVMRPWFCVIKKGRKGEVGGLIWRVSVWAWPWKPFGWSWVNLVLSPCMAPNSNIQANFSARGD